MQSNDFIRLEYEKLDYDKNGLTLESLDKLRALLTIRKDGNIIYICHPRHLFDVFIEDSDTKEVKVIDLDSLNIEKMININDYGRYSIVDQMCSDNNQCTYIMKKASHMINKYKNSGVSNFSYPFAILEEKCNELGETQYFVRGILKCDKEGFAIAFNKDALKALPKENIWQKSLRLSEIF